MGRHSLDSTRFQGFRHDQLRGGTWSRGRGLVDDVFVDGLEGVFWTIEVIEIVVMLVLDKVFGQGLQELKIHGDGLFVHADSQNLVNIPSHGVMNLICNLITILIDVARIEDGFILWIELNHGEGITISLC